MVNVKKATVHPEYSHRTKDYDIAVLEFSEPLKLSSEIEPIELAKKSPRTNSKCIVTGWGRLAEGSSTAFKLQAVELPIISRAVCSLRYFGIFTDRMFCAGKFKRGGKDSCQVNTSF